MFLGGALKDRRKKTGRPSGATRDRFRLSALLPSASDRQQPAESKQGQYGGFRDADRINNDIIKENTTIVQLNVDLLRCRIRLDLPSDS